jgi:hypothetical protein
MPTTLTQQRRGHRYLVHPSNGLSNIVIGPMSIIVITLIIGLVLSYFGYAS